jgi:hypothetical protein
LECLQLQELAYKITETSFKISVDNSSHQSPILSFDLRSRSLSTIRRGSFLAPWGPALASL